MHERLGSLLQVAQGRVEALKLPENSQFTRHHLEAEIVHWVPTDAHNVQPPRAHRVSPFANRLAQTKSIGTI